MTKAESSKAKAEQKLQTITLKAFIHCEGCRRKIRRIIRVLDGVEDVDVESGTGKVTVTGSNLDVKDILQRLQKHGKQAELWPSAISASKPAGTSQPKSASSNTPSSSDGSAKGKQKSFTDTGGEKPVPQSNSEAKKGGKKQELQVADQNAGGKQEGGGTNKSKQAEKNKSEKEQQTNFASEAECRDASSPQGKGGNGEGRKGKKGGHGSSSGGGGGGATVPDLPFPPPPHHLQDIPIASLPVSNTVTVSANRAPSPYDYIQTGYSEYNVDYATHMFSDENANNCSLM